MPAGRGGREGARRWGTRCRRATSPQPSPACPPPYGAPPPPRFVGLEDGLQRCRRLILQPCAVGGWASALLAAYPPAPRSGGGGGGAERRRRGGDTRYGVARRRRRGSGGCGAAVRGNRSSSCGASPHGARPHQRSPRRASLEGRTGAETQEARRGAGPLGERRPRAGARGGFPDQLNFQDRPTVKVCTVESSLRIRPASASPRMISLSSQRVLRYSSLVDSLSVSMVCRPRPKVQPSRS